MKENLTPKKKMIILWHWKELRDKKTPSDKIGITDAPYSEIIRINDGFFHNRAKDLEHLLMDLLGKLETEDQAIVFLHETSFLKDHYDKIIPKIHGIGSPNSIKLRKFGGGKSFIYYNPVTETGLLQQRAGFPNGKAIMQWTTEDGEARRERPNIIQHFGDEFKIKKNNFDAVWYYYLHQPKKKIFEFVEDLIPHLIGEDAEDKWRDHRVPDVIKTTPLIAPYSEISDKDYWKQCILDTYGHQFSNVWKAYENMIDFIEGEPINTNYLENLRDKFDRLIKVMPEKIYE